MLSLRNKNIYPIILLILIGYGGGDGATWLLSKDGGVEELHLRPNSRATPQVLDQRLKIKEVVPKMARRRGSDAGQSRRRWVRFCKGVRIRRCKKNSPFILSCIGKKGNKKRLWPWQRSRESFQRTRQGRASSSENTEGIWQRRKLWERFRLQEEKLVCLIFAITGSSGLGTGPDLGRTEPRSRGQHFWGPHLR